MIFILKQFDIPLLTFELKQDGLDGFVCRILNKTAENAALLPPGMSLTDAGLLDWLKKRIIPRQREFVDKILAVYGLHHHNLLGIIKLCFGLSLNDSYWVVPEEFTGLFCDYNLYENPFEKALSLIAYTGYGSTRPGGFSSSPEFTTNGNLRKCWRKINGRILLFKGGSSGAANAGNEPYSEFFAAQIAEAMGVCHVSYNLAKWKGILCSTCELFTDLNHSFVPAWRLFPEKKFSEIAASLREMGEDFFAPFCDMMIFDALLYNTDRHLGNFGLLIDNQSNRPCALAPVFDNGLSLFPAAMADDFADLPAYAASRTTAFGASFDELALAFITERQRKQLRKLIDFKLSSHSTYRLPGWRIKALNRFLALRVQELLNLHR